MAETGWSLPGSAASVVRPGASAFTWINAERATNATANTYSEIETDIGISNYLEVTNFGFSIPSNMQVVGIGVRIRKAATVAAPEWVRDSEVRLVISNEMIGDNKATSTNWPRAPHLANDNAAAITETYGGEGDLWSLASAPNVSDNSFGVRISLDATVSKSFACVYSIWMNIYYEETGNFYEKVGGVWRKGQMHERVSGVYRPGKLYERIGGIWRS